MGGAVGALEAGGAMAESVADSADWVQVDEARAALQPVHEARLRAASEEGRAARERPLEAEKTAADTG